MTVDCFVSADVLVFLRARMLLVLEASFMFCFLDVFSCFLIELKQGKMSTKSSISMATAKREPGQQNDDDGDIHWPVLERWCHHDPVCESMYSHNMLMIADEFIVTMENMAMEALNKGKNSNHIEEHKSAISSKTIKQNNKRTEKHRQKDARARMPQNWQRQKGNK